MSKRVLLTGAAGFIGSHLTKRLLQDGFNVVGLDNLCTGREKNLEEFKNHPQFQFIHADLVDGIPDSLKNQNWDWVMHFASPASPPKYFALPIETMRVNSEGTRHCLDLCKKSQAKFFYASTSEIYGDPLVHPQPESYLGNVSSTGVRSIYDESKRFGEAITYSYAREFKVPVRVIRIFNTYGPKMDPNDGRVVTNLMFQALNAKPITIYGDGSQTRSFQYVDDLVEGIRKLMEVNFSEPVNLGNPEEFTILEFAKLVKEIVPTTSEFKFCALPSDDPKQRKPDITLAKRVLQWEPKVELREGLKLTLQYFQKFE